MILGLFKSRVAKKNAEAPAPGNATASPAGLDAEDRELLARLHRGHDASARALWSRHAPRLLAVAASVLGSRGRSGTAAGGNEDPHDIVQMVFCSLLELPRGSIDGIACVGSYLTRATRNQALNARRAAARRAARTGATADERTPDQGIPGATDLHDAIGRLEEADREVLMLKHAAGLTFDQLADALDEQRGTIVARHSAALNRLRAMMNPALQGESA